MFRHFIVSLVIAATIGPVSIRSQGPELWFPTTAQELVEPTNPSDKLGALMDRPGYDRFLDGVRRNPVTFLVPLRALPANLSDAARFGINFVVGEENRGFVVDADGVGGWVLYADVAGTGDLDHVTPIALTRQNDGSYTTLVPVPVGNGAGPLSPMRFVIRPTASGKSAEIRGGVFNRTVRRGALRVDGRQIPFALFGINGGIYDKPGASVWIDLNGDGHQAADTELFQVPRDKELTFRGATYVFTVEHTGASLALRLVSHTAVARPTLKPGTAAPDFSVVDVEGHRQQLSAYRGKVVILDFWATWCGPCRVEAPQFAALYQRHHANGLVVLGFSPDAAAQIRAYAREVGYIWPQIAEPADGRISALFRLDGYPTHYLIGRDGHIVLSQEGGITDTTFERDVDRQFASRTKH